MNLKSAPLFWLLQQYFIAIGSACLYETPSMIVCPFSADSVGCDTPWYHSSRQYVTCYSFGDRMSYTEAETYCRDKGAQLPLLQESSKEDMLTTNDTLAAYNISAVWLAPLFEPKLSTHCPAFTVDQIKTLNCDERVQVICEKKAVFGSGKEKPYLHVSGRGDLEKRFIQKGSRVTITCSTIRSSIQKPYIQMQLEDNKTIITFKDSSSSFNKANLSCGVKSVASMTIQTTDAMLYKKIHLRCFINAPTPDFCGEEMDSCAGPLSYLLTPKPDKPSVQVNVNALFSATVFEPDDIVANCSAILDKHCTIVWALTVDGKQRFLNEGNPGVFISEPEVLAHSGKLTWMSTVRLTTKGRGWADKAVTLTCYSEQDEQTRCEKDDFWCRTVIVNIRPVPPKVDVQVEISKLPNIVSDEIVAKCTSFGFKTVWAITDLSVANQKRKIVSQFDRGVYIKEKEVSENSAWMSHLTMKTEIKGLTGKRLILSCLTAEISGDYQPECLESYFWCDTFLLEVESNTAAQSEKDGNSPPESFIILFGLTPFLLSIALLLVCKLMSVLQEKTRR